MSTAHPHDGHRERLKQRYIKFGADALADHELLELLLFFSRPRIDTNGIAHALINDNEGFKNVFSADVDRLKMTVGVGDSSAILLSLIGDVHKRILENETQVGGSYTTLSQVGEFLCKHYSNEREEKLSVMFLDKNMKLISFATATRGNSHGTVFSHTEIARKALLKGASGVIISHNHPGGDPLPSSSDRNFTHLLEASLYAINIALIEHIIICENSFFPTMMTSSGPGRLSLINGLLGEGFLKKFYGN